MQENKTSLGEKHPIKYKFWRVAKKTVLYLFFKIRALDEKVENIEYDYWTLGKTLKEYKSEAMLKQKKCHNYQTGNCNLSFKYCTNCEDFWCEENKT